MKPAGKRNVACWAERAFPRSDRRACRLASIDRSTRRYPSRSLRLNASTRAGQWISSPPGWSTVDVFALGRWSICGPANAYRGRYFPCREPLRPDNPHPRNGFVFGGRSPCPPPFGRYSFPDIAGKRPRGQARAQSPSVGVSGPSACSASVLLPCYQQDTSSCTHARNVTNPSSLPTRADFE